MNIPLYAFCALSIVGALSLVFAKHPVRGAMGLLLTMACISGIFAILQAHLVAAFQIIIYAGAIMVLIVYILMLLDVHTESFYRRYTNLKTLSIISIGFISFVSLIALGKIENSTLPDVTPEFGSIKVMANSLMTNYLLSFEIASLILLVGVIAAVALVNRDIKELEQ